MGGEYIRKCYRSAALLLSGDHVLSKQHSPIRGFFMRLIPTILTLTLTLSATTALAATGDVAPPAPVEDAVIAGQFERFVTIASGEGYQRIFASATVNNPRGNFDVNAENDVYVFAACGENCKFMTLNVYSKTFEKVIKPQDESNEPKTNFINFSTVADARFSTGGTATCIDTSKPCVMRLMVYKKALSKPEEETESEVANGDEFTL